MLRRPAGWVLLALALGVAAAAPGHGNTSTESAAFLGGGAPSITLELPFAHVRIGGGGGVSLVLGGNAPQQQHQQPRQQQQQQQQPRQQQQQKQQQKQQKHKAKPLRQPVVAAAPTTAGLVVPKRAPMCEWRPELGPAACQVHRAFFLAVTMPAKPESFPAAIITGAAARDLACTAHRDAAACLDAPATLRCGWQLSGMTGFDASGCRSNYMAELSMFWAQLAAPSAGAAGPARVLSAANALTSLSALSCPGSLAAKAATCGSAFPLNRKGAYAEALCSSHFAGCVLDARAHACIASPALAAHLRAMAPADLGQCSAACFLRMLANCPAGIGDAKACWARPGCAWSGGSCVPDVWGAQLDRWGRRVAEAAGVCAHNAGAGACAKAGKAAELPLSPAAFKRALDAGMPPLGGAAQAKCPL